MQTLSPQFMKVRAALGAIDNGTVTDVNTTGGMRLSSAGDMGPVEVQKIIESMIRDAFSRATEFRQLITRRPILSGISVQWLLKTGTGSKAAFYSDGGTGTPVISTKVQLNAVAKSIRSDYEVSGLLMAGSFLDVLADEAADAITDMELTEEAQFINGTDTNAGGSSSGYIGLLQLMRSYTAHGDTSSIYGITRGNGVTHMDVQAVDAGVSGSSLGTLSLADLDAAITKVEKRELNARRAFLCSFERADEINALLQPQQRFTGSMDINGGLRVQTYKNIPIIRSKRMEFNGVTNTGSADNSTDADNAMYLLALDDIEFRTVGGVDMAHVPIMGGGDSTNYLSRADVVGGYYKTYGLLVMKRFDNQCIIWNLNTP